MKEFYFENRIYYRMNEFRPERLTLVFIHGVSGSSSAWWPYEKTLGDKYNLLTYDLRGHGLSKKYPRFEDYSIQNFVRDFHDLVTHLNLNKFILLSSSFGTLIAREYVKSYRGTVSAMIFTSTEDFREDALILKFLRPAIRLLTGAIGILPFNAKPRGHVDYSKIKNSDWSIERNIADTRNTGLHAQLYTLRQSFLPGREDALEKIDVPTLVMHGEKDSLVPIENAITFAQKIKNAEFIIIPKYDHDIHHNAVKEMSSAIILFIESNRKAL